MPVQNNLDARLQARIESFVEEISSIVRDSAMDAVRQALETGGSSRTPSRGPGRPAGSGAGGARRKIVKKTRGSRRVRRTAADLEKLGAQVLTHVKSNPGHRLEEIGSALDVPTSELKRPVFLLLEAKELRTTGQRRGTKYFAGAGGKKATKKKRS